MRRSSSNCFGLSMSNRGVMEAKEVEMLALSVVAFVLKNDEICSSY